MGCSRTVRSSVNRKKGGKKHFPQPDALGLTPHGDDGEWCYGGMRNGEQS